MRAAILAFCMLMIGCCGSRTECTEEVTTETSGALGEATFERCGVGYCVTMTSSVSVVRFHLPFEAGTVSLEDLEAVICPPNGAACSPLIGTMIVRAVNPPAFGQPVGRLDADLDIANPQAHVTIDYEEDLATRCREVKRSFGAIPFGPGM